MRRPPRRTARPFVKVAKLMAEAGLTAPQVLDWDEAKGFLLLDDLGAQTMLEVIDPADAGRQRGRSTPRRSMR